MSDDRGDSGCVGVPRQRPATIIDVARAAHVTPGTASQALNGKGAMRPDTRARIVAVAQQLEYRPNDLVHSLLRRRTFTVGLLSADRYGRFSIPLLEGIEDALGEARLSVILCNARDNPQRERQHIETLLAKHVDGIIVTGRRIDPRPPIMVGKSSVPVLYAFTQVDDPAALNIISDDAQGAALAAAHLLAQGRRHIAHIGGLPSFLAARLRAEGLLSALAEHGAEVPPALVRYGEWTEAWGYAAMRDLLAASLPIDAVFCASDLIARGAADALRDRGVRVPADVALVGVDNWEIIAAATRPPLTTVDLDLTALGRRAGESLIDVIGGRPQSGTIRMPCHLVVRDSCGARQP